MTQDAPRTPIVTESRSSVTIKQNARGEAQVEVKVYEGTTAEQVESVVTLAVHTYLAVQANIADGQVKPLTFKVNPNAVPADEPHDPALLSDYEVERMG